MTCGLDAALGPAGARPRGTMRRPVRRRRRPRTWDVGSWGSRRAARVLGGRVEGGAGEVEPDAGRPSAGDRLGSRRVSSRSDWALPSNPPMSAASRRGPLAVVPEGRVAEIVRQTGGLDQVRVQPRAAPSSRPTWATPGSGSGGCARSRRRLSCGSFVLADSRRKDAGWTSRARSRAKSSRSARRVAGSSRTQRSRSTSV